MPERWYTPYLEAAPAVLTADFWRRMFTDPLAAPLAMPREALKAGAIAGGATLAAGLALKAGVVGGASRLVRGAWSLVRAPFVLAKAAAPVAPWVVRHPILTYGAVSNIELPIEIVRAFGGWAARPQVPPAPGVSPAVPMALETPGLRPPRPFAPPSPTAGGFSQGDLSRLFAGQVVTFGG